MSANITCHGLLLSANVISLKSCLESYLSKPAIVRSTVLKTSSDNASQFAYVTLCNITTEHALSQLKNVCYNGKYITCTANPYFIKPKQFTEITNSNMDSFAIKQLRVTHIEDFDAIYAIEEGLEDSLGWESMKMWFEKNSQVYLPIIPQPDKLYGWFSNAGWMRVVLIAPQYVVTSDQVRFEMQLVDNGRCITAAGSELCDLPSNLQRMPPFAFLCCIDHLTTSDTNAVVTVLRQELMGKCFEAHVFQETGANKSHKFKRLSVDLICDNQSLRHYLINEKLASPCPSVASVSSTTSLKSPQKDPAPKKYFISYYRVTSDDIVEIFFHLEGDDKPLNEMAHWFENNWSSLNAPVGALDCRRLYAARFSVDNLWYRCAVLCDRNSNALRVCYVDFGNSEEKKLSELLTLPDDMATAKPVALHCYLAGVTINSSRKDDLDLLFNNYLHTPLRLTMRTENRLLDASAVDVWIDDHTSLACVILDRCLGYPFKEKSISLLTAPLADLRNIVKNGDTCHSTELTQINSLCDEFQPENNGMKVIAPRCMANFNIKNSTKENRACLADRTLENRAISQVILEINKLRRVLKPLEQIFGLKSYADCIDAGLNNTLLNVAAVMDASSVDLELLNAKKVVEEKYSVWQDQRKSLMEYVMLNEATTEECSEKLTRNHSQRDAILHDLSLLENAMNGSFQELSAQSANLASIAKFLDHVLLQLGLDGGKENVAVALGTTCSTTVEEWLPIFVKRAQELFLLSENCRIDAAAASEAVSKLLLLDLTTDDCVEVATKLPSTLTDYWNALCELRRHVDLRVGQTAVASANSERLCQLLKWTLRMKDRVEERQCELDGMELFSSKCDVLRQELQAERKSETPESFWQEAFAMQRSVRDQVRQLRRALVDLQDAEDDEQEEEIERDKLINVAAERVTQLRDSLHETLELEDEICNKLLRAVHVSPEILLMPEALRLNLRQRRSLLRFWEPNYLEAKPLSDAGIVEGLDGLFLSRWRGAPALLLKLIHASVTVDMLNQVQRCGPVTLLCKCGVRAAFRPRNEPQQLYVLFEASPLHSVLSSEKDDLNEEHDWSCARNAVRCVLKELHLAETPLVQLLQEILNGNSTLDDNALSDNKNDVVVSVTEEEGKDEVFIEVGEVDLDADVDVHHACEPTLANVDSDLRKETSDSISRAIIADEKDDAEIKLETDVNESSCKSSLETEISLDQSFHCDHEADIFMPSAAGHISNGLGRGLIVGSREF